MIGFKRYAQQFVPSQASREVWCQLTLPEEDFACWSCSQKSVKDSFSVKEQTKIMKEQTTVLAFQLA